jgi:hypothetical protein
MFIQKWSLFKWGSATRREVFWAKHFYQLKQGVPHSVAFTSTERNRLCLMWLLLWPDVPRGVTLALCVWWSPATSLGLPAYWKNLKEIIIIEYCFRPPLCTLVRINWGNQSSGHERCVMTGVSHIGQGLNPWPSEGKHGYYYHGKNPNMVWLPYTSLHTHQYNK